MTDQTPIRRALLSVSDKTGLIDLGKALSARGVELLSTGGSAKTLREAGLTVKDVADITGFPEMMDGRVKTLHPMVHGGLLALRDNADHVKAMEAHGIAPIDLLVVNLYPFEETVAKGAEYADCVENIDIFCANIAQSIHTELSFTTSIQATVLLTNDSRILELNSQFRNQNKPTNVLSFPSGEEAPDPENGKLYLGDIAISFETVSREATEGQKTLNHHLTHMIVHGILHLLGYDHETDEEAEEMEGLEIKILHALGISDPYAVC